MWRRCLACWLRAWQGIFRDHARGAADAPLLSGAGPAQQPDSSLECCQRCLDVGWQDVGDVEMLSRLLALGLVEELISPALR